MFTATLVLVAIVFLIAIVFIAGQMTTLLGYAIHAEFFNLLCRGLIAVIGAIIESATGE